MEEKFQKIGTLLSNCFISGLLTDEHITDISYNGSDIFYSSNKEGRKKYNQKVEENDVYCFLRQICNLFDVSFSISEPILDITFLNYRLNAVYKNIGRKKRENCISFSIRKFNINTNPIDNDSEFMPNDVRQFLKFMMSKKSSILIAGETGSGKTQLQRYMINLLHSNERIVVIDTINELDVNYNDNLDVTCLIEDQKRKIELKDLVKLSLRYSPDYIVLAEARGKEFEDVLTSSLSGVSNITTIHAKNNNTILERCANLIQINNKNLEYSLIKKMILNHFELFIYLEKKVGPLGDIKRKITRITYIKENSLIDIFVENNKYFKIPDNLKEEFNRFMEEENEL